LVNPSARLISVGTLTISMLPSSTAWRVLCMRMSIWRRRWAMTGPWSAWMALWLSVRTVVGRDGSRPMLAIKLRSSHTRRTQLLIAAYSASHEELATPVCLPG
jgi:hypothetical protein